MSYMIYASAGLAVLLYAIYCRLYPRPIPGIPYNPDAAGRVLGDRPGMVEAFRSHGEFSQYRSGLTRKLNFPLVQLLSQPPIPPYLYLEEPREVEDILLRRNREFDRSPFVGTIVGTIMPHASIVKTSADPRFRAQRRAWADTMAPDFLRRVVAPTLHRAGHELVELWQAKAARADGAPVDIRHDFDAAALDAIWVAILGESLGGLRDRIDAVKGGNNGRREKDTEIDNDDDDDDDEVSQVAKGIGMQNTMNYMNRSALGWRTYNFPSLQMWLLKRGKEYRRFDDFKNRQIQRVMRTSIRKFQDAIASGVEAPDSCAMDLVLRREVQAAHKAGVPLRDLTRDIELRDEVFFLLWAGHDTTSNTLSWWIKYMARYQGAQTKLRAALQEALPSTTPAATAAAETTPRTGTGTGTGTATATKTTTAATPPQSPPSAAAILDADIPYLDAAVEEALRLAGTVITVRKAVVDTTILGCRVPRGTNVVFHNLMHARPVPVAEELRSATSRAAHARRQQQQQHGASAAARGRHHERAPPLGIVGPAGDDLDDFVPERWLVAGEDGRAVFDPCALPRLGFGDGPRGCFGRKLAMYELRIMIALTTISFKMLPLPDELDNMNAVETMFRKPRDCYAKFEVLQGWQDLW